MYQILWVPFAHNRSWRQLFGLGGGGAPLLARGLERLIGATGPSFLLRSNPRSISCLACRSAIKGVIISLTVKTGILQQNRRPSASNDTPAHVGTRAVVWCIGQSQL
jgi:hypothetical protein